MTLETPKYKIIEQEPGINGIYKQIELAGRTCYKSEDKITEDSAKSFVMRMIESKHTAMLEHGTVYLKIEHKYDNGVDMKDIYDISLDMILDPHTKTVIKDDITYVTTNLRVLVERYKNDWEDILKYYYSEYTENHERRVTVRFVCDRGVSHEFVRHRVFSFAQESTRYCNYSKNKFGNELTFIIPCWCDDIPNNTQLKDKMEVNKFVWGDDNLSNAVITENGVVKRKVSKFTQSFLYEMIGTEDTYIELIAAGYKPQEARAILPNSLKTELIMTGFISDWNHFFDLRALGTTGAPHPQALQLAEPLLKEFKDKKYV